MEYIDYGTGNRVGNTIFLNRKLLKFPKLHDAILNHEKKHTNTWNWSDVTLDLKNSDLKGVKKDYYYFLLTTPNAWLNYLPVLKLGNKLCIDLTLSIFYFLVLVILFLIWLI